MNYKLLQGNNLELLKNLESNSIDSVVTDPPYGLSFMNKKWDYDVPSIEFWKEVYRVLKPGGHILSFGGTRTYHRLVVNIEDAGFEIRDQIQWIYGSGFPKSLNIDKAIDKMEGNEREVVGDQTEWEGWGTALKPANEPICVARKPLSEKSVAENVLKWKTGGLNIDACRVGRLEGDISKGGYGNGSIGFGEGINSSTGGRDVEWKNSTEGRFPANVILECICDEVIEGEKGDVFSDKGNIHTNPNCTCKIMDEQSGDSKSIKSKRGGAVSNGQGRYNWNIDDKEYIQKYECGYTDEGGASRFFYNAKVSKDERNLDKIDIHTNPECPCRLMDDQSGFLKGDSPNRKPRVGGHRPEYVGTDNNSPKKTITNSAIFDSGGASRFFYNAKVSKSERNEGLDEFEEKETNTQDSILDYSAKYHDHRPLRKNTHPTVKPVNLMAYLCRLITPPNGIILDPFVGSGSTGIAALLEGFNFIGMEMDEEYIKIAEGRISNYEQYRKFLK